MTTPKSKRPPKDSELDDIARNYLLECPDVSALSADSSERDYVLSSGATPVEFLSIVYRNPFQKMEHRIAAAKAAAEYTHRKLPSKLEVESNTVLGVRSLDPNALKNLSAKDLAVLEKLLEKAGEVK